MRRIVFIIIFFISVTGYAQRFGLDTSKRVNVIAAPALFKTPETGWAFGASGSANFKTSFKNDTLTRASVVSITAIFTEREQNIQSLNATIYFPKEKYILYFQSMHKYFPDNFWGIGTHSNNTDLERYVFEQISISPHLKRKFFKHTFFGALTDYQYLYKLNYNEEGVMDNSSFYGKEGYQLLGLGLTASYDTRNSTYWPTKGVFLQTQFTGYNKNVYSTYSFSRWMAEARLFKTTFRNQVIAAQFYSYATLGQTPFRSLASFGGVDNLRGFYQGRFRDKSMYSAIVEYRVPLFWKISACIFGGVGDVYDYAKNININTIKHSYGGGLRLTILDRDKLNVRFDYGYSDNYNKGFYFTLGECF